MIKFLVAFFFTTSLISFLQAQTVISKDEMMKFVNEAAQVIKEKGKEAAFAEFYKNDGDKWMKYNKELYLFAYDFLGVNQFHALRPENKGKNLFNIKANGVFFIQKMIKITQPYNGFGRGEVEYFWDNPVTQKMEKKMAYVIGYGDGFIGSGIYVK